MKAYQKVKKGFFLLIIVFSLFGKLSAQDTIRFSWQIENENSKSVNIQTNKYETFTVNWGDGSPIETKTGEGVGGPETIISLSHFYSEFGVYTVTIVTDNNCQFTYFNCSGHYNSESNQWENNRINNLSLINCSALSTLWCSYNELIDLDLTGCSSLYELSCCFNPLINLNLTNCSSLTSVNCTDNQLISLRLEGCTSLIYLYCARNQIIELDLTDCSALVELQCSSNKLRSLYLAGTPALQRLYCYDNQLQLSYLFAVHSLISNPNVKGLGTQNLKSQTAIIGEELFSDQSVFDGIYTNYSVLKDDETAVETDYSVNNGKIRFNNNGTYIVTMTNEAIVSSTNYPAEVIATINIGTVGIQENRLSNIKIYPNPTSSILFVECESIDTIILYDVLGKEVCSKIAKGKTEINISHLTKGIYTVNIISKNKIVGTSKIIKQ